MVRYDGLFKSFHDLVLCRLTHPPGLLLIAPYYLLNQIALFGYTTNPRFVHLFHRGHRL